jgi:hypothetical protein
MTRRTSRPLSPPRRGLLPVNTSSAQAAGRPAGHAASPRRLSTATWARRRPGTTVDARCPTEQGGAPQTCGVSTTACCGQPEVAGVRPGRRGPARCRCPAHRRVPQLAQAFPMAPVLATYCIRGSAEQTGCPTAVRYWSCTAATSRPGALTFTPLVSAQARTAFGSTPARIVPARAGPGRRRRRVGAAGRSGPRRRTRRAVLRRAGTWCAAAAEDRPARAGGPVGTSSRAARGWAVAMTRSGAGSAGEPGPGSTPGLGCRAQAVSGRSSGAVAVSALQ